MVQVFYFYFLRYLAVPIFHFSLATTMCGSPPPVPPPAPAQAAWFQGEVREVTQGSHDITANRDMRDALGKEG